MKNMLAETKLVLHENDTHLKNTLYGLLKDSDTPYNTQNYITCYSYIHIIFILTFL
jgi:hypothetical protein